MKQLDWIVLVFVSVGIVLYGLWKTRRVRTATSYLSGNQSNWWVIGLSVMATQASAITFLSTPGQAYYDGLGFVQFYFGLPLAMIILCVWVVPRFFKMKIFTAYEFLEQRFGVSSRVLTASLFLLQRGLAAGITIFAPAIILSTILGWNLPLTIILIGFLVIIYTLVGGTEAVSQTQKQQMMVIILGMVVAFVYIIRSLPLGMTDTLYLSGALGKLEAVNFDFDLSNRYTIWSAFLGGTFLFLSYFGTDQSQVQRYLSGKNLDEARLGLLFNGLLKVPMQFFILFIGVMVFVFFQYHQPPLNFNPIAERQLQEMEGYTSLNTAYSQLHTQKQNAISDWQEARKSGDEEVQQSAVVQLQHWQNEEKKMRQQVVTLLKQQHPDTETNERDYVFIHYILHYLPAGLVGLLIAVILSAAMSSTSSELNALATTSVVDIYKRVFFPSITDGRFLVVSRLFTLFWGLVAIGFALSASLFENLIQAVNIIGSLFYGVILGVFALAFFFKKINGKAVFYAVLVVEPFIIWLYFLDLNKVINLSYLWLNPIGCLLLILVAHAIQVALPNSFKKKIK
ncbi:MAG: sodium:solute symporter [Capnocytophaga sp.]|nr:sodium:solute symporter [Capnocytophaga sp.]